MPTQDQTFSPDHTVCARLTDSQRKWLRVRDHLRENRAELCALAVEYYEKTLTGVSTVARTPLLSRSGWLPARPFPLGEVTLAWDPGPADPVGPFVTGTGEVTEHLRPRRSDGSRYPSYSAAMADLAAPRTFQNRSTYRLHAADLTAGLTAGGPRMVFGEGRYFDGLDVGEACAHEFAAHQLGLVDGTPLRDAVGDLCDPGRRGMNLAVSVLTLRVEGSALGAEGVQVCAVFPLHWRDPVKVGHAGGLYTVMPVGVFQASTDRPRQECRGSDFSLWRCMIREFSEELLGAPEHHDNEHHDNEPLDNDAWPFAARLTQALVDGQVRADVLGLGVDPLTLATDLLVTVSIDADLYDDLFTGQVDVNDEGSLAGPDTSPGVSPAGLWPFTASTVEILTTDKPLQPASAATLRLALASEVHISRIMNS